MKTLLTWMMLVLSIIALILFKVLVVNPAYEKLPDGHYGEMHGPVAFFKEAVYLVLTVLFLIATYLLVKGRR
jgi:hypothetical protein